MGEQAHHRVIVIGTGFAGLGMAIRLTQQAMTDFVVLERAAEVGGTWRDNSYPGCACDVPSQLYSFSFELNPSWSRSFSGQQEIWDYLRRCVNSYGLRPHIRFHHEVLEAAWDHAGRRWRVRTNRGELTCDVLVAATGALSDPSIPDIPGLDCFQGKVFHSARWDSGYELRDRRVAVVGTGASAIQFIPKIQPEVTALTIFQRTPPWIVPRGDRDISAVEQRLYRALPGLQRLVRAGIYCGRESLVPGFAVNPRLLKVAELTARAHLRRQVPDPALRARLTPDYAIGCKRILISNDYLPVLARSNVDLVTSGLASVGTDWVRAADGTRRQVDTVIFGTGFHVTEMPIAARIHGRDGRALAEVWSQGAQAHRGTTVAGFPNLFMLVGPNTGLGHSSLIYMIESQVAYIIDALRYLRRTGAAAVEVRPPAQRAYNEVVQRRMDRTVWTTGGCASWYLDAQGRNTTLWPTFTWRFRRATRRFQPAEYVAYQRHPRAWWPDDRGSRPSRCKDGSVRLFVALTPPDEIIEELWASTVVLRELAPQLRWTRPAQWHVTLAFLGEVADDVVAELSRRLARAGARHQPLSLALGGGGRFGHQVLWTQVQGDRDRLRKLAGSVRAAARRSRLPVEQRPYRPHLTLALADHVADLRPLVERLACWQGQPWVATRLYLVRSHLGAGPDGSARHEPIAGWPLGNDLPIDG